MTKILKLGTVEEMHKQLELPEGKYGIVVEAINVRSAFNPDHMPTALYKSIQAGKIEINSIRYSDTAKGYLNAFEPHTTIEVVAYEVDNTTLTANTGLIAVADYTPFILVVITDDYILSNYKMDSIELVDIDGVLKADLLVRPLLPVTESTYDVIDALLFKLSYIPFNDYINKNYLIAYDKNSLNSILSMYVLLSNRHDLTNIKLVDINDIIDDEFDKTYIVVNTEGDVSIDGSVFVNVLDAIKNMCDVFNIQLIATDMMIEFDCINRGVAGYDAIKKILIEVISTDDGKAGFIENTIPMVSTGMYKTFTNFFSSELVELTIRKRIAKEILDAAQVAHSDSYTVTIISSNVLLDEIVLAICDREVENPTTEHIYAILSNHTEYTDLVSICFNNTELLDNFENNITADFGDSIDMPVLLDLANDTAETIGQNSKLTDYGVRSYILNPMYCN